ncbi:MAG: hypothetical protein HQL06_06760 [Nitrospirae bacterium]|nr:hypothetical protein [Nitrospirota bacterium]
MHLSSAGGAIREGIALAKAWGTRFSALHVNTFSVVHSPEGGRLHDLMYMEQLEKDIRATLG